MNTFVSFVKGLDSHPNFCDKMFSFAWLEGRLKAEIGKIEDLTDWNEIEKWPAGRIFGSKGEYRWQFNKNKKIHAVLILDEGHLPEDFQKNRLEIKTQNDWVSKLILWGDWINPAEDPKGNPEGKPLFFAPEIPKNHLSYPLDMDRSSLKAAAKDGKTPRLIIRRYCHHDEKQLDKSLGDFIRCAGFDIKK